MTRRITAENSGWTPTLLRAGESRLKLNWPRNKKHGATTINLSVSGCGELRACPHLTDEGNPPAVAYPGTVWLIPGQGADALECLGPDDYVQLVMCDGRERHSRPFYVLA